jgi:hypothetical protein
MLKGEIEYQVAEEKRDPKLNDNKSLKLPS